MKRRTSKRRPSQARRRRKFRVTVPVIWEWAPQVAARAKVERRSRQHVISWRTRFRSAWAKLWHSPRWISFLVLLGVGTLLYLAGVDMAYSVTDVRVDGASTIAHQTVVEASGLKGMHMFWLSPARAAEQVASVPNVLTATVEIALPNQAYITIAECTPVMAWDQAGERFWVDADGRLMQMRQESADRLVILSQEPDKLQIGDQISLEVLASALLLRRERPNIESLYYDLDNGLSYQDGRHWRAYFGVGRDVAQKLAVYEALVADLQSRGLQPRYISVINKDKPYYSLAEPAE